MWELNIDSNYLTMMSLNRQRSLSYIGISDVEIQADMFEIQAAELFEEKLKMTGYVDFISMINIATLMIREQIYIRKTLEARFPWLLIDEYQDLGKALLMWRMSLMMLRMSTWRPGAIKLRLS